MEFLRVHYWPRLEFRKHTPHAKAKIETKDENPDFEPSYRALDATGDKVPQYAIRKKIINRNKKNVSSLSDRSIHLPATRFLETIHSYPWGYLIVTQPEVNRKPLGKYR